MLLLAVHMLRGQSLIVSGNHLFYKPTGSAY